MLVFGFQLYLMTFPQFLQLSEAVNDLGGQAGLWLGLSVVSIVECIGLCLILLLFCVTGKRMSGMHDRDEVSFRTGDARLL